MVASDVILIMLRSLGIFALVMTGIEHGKLRGRCKWTNEVAASGKASKASNEDETESGGKSGKGFQNTKGGCMLGHTSGKGGKKGKKGKGSSGKGKDKGGKHGKKGKGKW